MRLFKKFLFVFLKGVLLLSGYVGLQKLTELGTKGFCLQKILADDLPPRQEWDVAPPSREEEREIIRLLDQPFYLLGMGSECFVFRSQDHRTVLKFFKLDHARPVYFLKGLVREDHRHDAGTLSDHWLTRLSLIEPFDTWRKRVLGIREFRIARTFSSSKIAYEELREETGVFYLHLNPTEKFHKRLTLIDGNGYHFTIDLDSTRFLLQRYATPLETHFAHLIAHNREAQARASIDSLFALILNRCRKGFADRDFINRNIGYLGTQAIEFDLGSFTKDPTMQEPSASRRELAFATLEFREWLEEHSPELLAYFETQLKERLLTLGIK